MAGNGRQWIGSVGAGACETHAPSRSRKVTRARRRTQTRNKKSRWKITGKRTRGDGALGSRVTEGESGPTDKDPDTHRGLKEGKDKADARGERGEIEIGSAFRGKR